MINKSWNSINHLSVAIVIFLAFLGAFLNSKRYCAVNSDKHKQYSKTKRILRILSQILFDAISVGTISLIVYIGLIGYGVNEFLAVSIAGFLAKEGNSAIYHFKLFVAEKLGANSLVEELQKEKEMK